MLKRFKILLIIISLSLALCFMNNTYSRYVASTNGKVEAIFAKWQILVNNNNITNNSVSEINLTPIIETNENVKANTIAPSSKGYFDIFIDPTNVDISFTYTIKLSVVNENMPDLLITKYSIIEDKDEEEVIVALKGDTITNKMMVESTPEDFKFKSFTVRVYFEWIEGNNVEILSGEDKVNEVLTDEGDTLIGLDAATNDTKLNLKAEIEFKQEL